MDIINIAIFITLAYSVLALPHHKFQAKDPFPWLVPVKYLPEIHHYPEYNTKPYLGHDIEYRRPKVELKGPNVDDPRPNPPPIPVPQNVVDVASKLGLLFFTSGIAPPDPGTLGTLPTMSLF